MVCLLTVLKLDFWLSSSSYFLQQKIILFTSSYKNILKQTCAPLIRPKMVIKFRLLTIFIIFKQKITHNLRVFQLKFTSKLTLVFALILFIEDHRLLKLGVKYNILLEGLFGAANVWRIIFVCTKVFVLPAYEINNNAKCISLLKQRTLFEKIDVF